VVISRTISTTSRRERSGAAPPLTPEIVPTYVGIFEQVGSGALEAVAAELEHETTLRDGQCLHRVLLDHQYGCALPVDRKDRVEHDVHHPRIEAQRGLVNHQQARLQ